MRLIDADAFKDALKRNCTPELCHDCGSNWCEFCCPQNDFIDLIDDAPTVEEKSYAMGFQDGLEDGLNDIRPKGKWIYKEFDAESGISRSYWCSNCGEPKSQWCDDFCQRCGADMRKGGAE